MNDTSNNLNDWFSVPRYCHKGHEMNPSTPGSIYLVQTKRAGLIEVCAECKREQSREWKRKQRAA